MRFKFGGSVRIVIGASARPCRTGWVRERERELELSNYEVNNEFFVEITYGPRGLRGELQTKNNYSPQ